MQLHAHTSRLAAPRLAAPGPVWLWRLDTPRGERANHWMSSPGIENPASSACASRLQSSRLHHRWALQVQAQQAVTSHPWQAVNLLLKDGWLPDLIFNKRLELSERSLAMCQKASTGAIASRSGEVHPLCPAKSANALLSYRRSELPGAQVGTVQGPGQMVVARSGLVCVAREQSGALGVFGRTIYEAVGTFSIRDGAS